MAIRWEKLTVKSQQAMEQAQARAAELGNPEVLPVHLLLALIEDREGALGCSRWVKIEEGPYKMDGPGPEYETLAAMGTMCLIDNLNAVSYANDLCNRYGIDTISTGVAIAFAMEAYEKGLIRKEDTGGIELKWGDEKAMLAMVHQIGKKEKLGALLGQSASFSLARSASRLEAPSSLSMSGKAAARPCSPPRTTRTRSRSHLRALARPRSRLTSGCIVSQ